jgi:hypothetical protein
MEVINTDSKNKVNNVIKEVKNGKQFIISKLVRNFF